MKTRVITADPASAEGQKHSKPAWALAATALALALPAVTIAQTAPLNDTGQTQCVNDAGAWAACDAASTGNAAVHPGQDGRFGRDRAPLAKTGGGAAGFDFTALNAGGTANNGDGTPGGHACVYDNVTGLLWSTETLPTTMKHANALAAGATYSRCGHTTGWRLPALRELLSIVHNGAYSPAIDPAYFPGTGTPSYGYWSADAYAPYSASAWYVYFYDGHASATLKNDSFSVRLVRSGQ